MMLNQFGGDDFSVICNLCSNNNFSTLKIRPIGFLEKHNQNFAKCTNCNNILEGIYYQIVKPCPNCDFNNSVFEIMESEDDPNILKLQLNTNNNCQICNTLLNGVKNEINYEIPWIINLDKDYESLQLYNDLYKAVNKLETVKTLSPELSFKPVKIPVKGDNFKTPFVNSNESIIEIYKKKIDFIYTLRLVKSVIKIDEAGKLSNNYLEYFKDKTNSTISYFQMIENLIIPTNIDNPVNFIKDFSSQIFNNISKNPYPRDTSEEYKGVNRYHHGSLNHMRSLLFIINTMLVMKLRSKELFDKLFDFGDSKKRKFLIVCLLSSLFKSILRIDESSSSKIGTYSVTPDILYKAFEDKSDLLQHFNNYNIEGNNVLNARLLRNLNLNDKKKHSDKTNYVFYKDSINSTIKPSIAKVNIQQYLDFKLKNYKETPGRKIAIILFGNPGAGKSVAKSKIFSKFGLEKENFINIDPDEVRYYSPLYVDDISGYTFKVLNLKKEVNIYKNIPSEINKQEKVNPQNKSLFKDKNWKSPNGDSTLNREAGFAYQDKYVSIVNAVTRSLTEVRNAVQGIPTSKIPLEKDGIFTTFIKQGKNIIYDTSCTNQIFCIDDIFEPLLKNGYEVIWLGVNTKKEVSMERAMKRQYKDGRWMLYGDYLGKTFDFINWENKYSFLNLKTKIDTVQKAISSTIKNCEFFIFNNTYENTVLETNYIIDPTKKDKIIKFDNNNYSGFPPMVFASAMLFFSILKSNQNLFELSDEDISRLSYSQVYYINNDPQKNKNQEILRLIDNWFNKTSKEILEERIINSNNFKMILADLCTNIGHYFDHCRQKVWNDKSKSIYNYRSNLFRKLIRVTKDDDIELTKNIMESLLNTSIDPSTGQGKRTQDIINTKRVAETCLQDDQFPEGEDAAKMIKNCCADNFNNSDFYELSTDFEKAWVVLGFEAKLTTLFK